MAYYCKLLLQTVKNPVIIYWIHLFGNNLGIYFVSALISNTLDCESMCSVQCREE